MRIHRIAVRNYRGIEHREVELPPTGAVLLLGPNESGKSSLLEAVDVLLTKKHSAGGAKFGVIRPAGRDVGTWVEADLEVGPYRFVYAKQYFKGKAAELRIVAPRPEQLSGDAAHDRVRGILDEHLDETLRRALWVRPAITPGDKVEALALHDATSLSRALDRATGSAARPDAGDGLFASVQAEYERYFTATGRPKQDLVEAEARAKAAATAAAELAVKVQAVEGDAQTLARVVQQRAAAADRAARLEQTVGQLTARCDALDAARAALADKQQAALRAEVEHRKALAARDALVGLTRAATAAASALAEHEARLVELAPAVQQAEATDAEATQALATARAARTRAQAALQTARALQARRGLTEQLTAAEERLAAAQEREAEGRTLAAWLAACPVGAASARAVADAERTVAVRRAALDAGAPRVRFEAHAAVTLVGGEEHELQPGDAHEERVEAPRRWRVDDRLTVTVEPGDGVEAPLESLRVAEEQLAEQLAALGLETAEAVRAKLEERRTQEARRAELRRGLAELLGGEGLSALRTRRDELAARLAALPPASTAAEGAEDREPSEGPGAAAPGPGNDGGSEASAGLDLEAAEAAAQAAGQAAHEAELRREGTRLALAAARERQAVEANRAPALRQAREQADAALAAEAGRGDAEARIAAAAQAEQAWAEARAEAEAQAQAYDPTDHDKARLERDAQGKALQDARRQQVELDKRRVGLEATLASKGQEGLGEQLQRARGDAAVQQRAFDGLRRRAEAARVLFEAFDRARRDARAAWRAPLRERIERDGKLLFGADFGVELAEDLSIATRTLHGTTLPFDSLSTGAKEQLGLLCRLAAAHLVADEAGLPLMLDDALGFSDAPRLRTLGALLSKAAEDGQVILLTSNEERYADVGGKVVVRLD